MRAWPLYGAPPPPISSSQSASSRVSRDWYNIEKSKRVKAFRCGEFDDCIQKAEAMAGTQSKRREKYARREDAIVDALELEKEHDEHMRTGTGNASAAKRFKMKGKQRSGDLEQRKLDDPSLDGAFRKYSRKNLSNRTKVPKERDTSDFEDGPRMKGLQDLVSGGITASSKLEDQPTLDGSSEVSLLDNPPDAEPSSQGKSMKRRRSGGKPGEEGGPSKRRDKRRAIQQVIENLERDTDDQTAAVTEGNHAPLVKSEGLCGEVEDKLSEECESTQETVSHGNAAHFLDALSSSKHLTTGVQPPADGTSYPAPPVQQRKPQAKGEASNKLKKSKRKNASDATKAGKAKADGTEQKSTISRLHVVTDGSTDSVCHNGKGKQASAKVEPEETITACCGSEEQRGSNTKGSSLHPKTRFEKQPVPMISLVSIKNKKPVDGYPVAVEVLQTTSSRKKARNGPPSWQTAKRSARQRTPRSEIRPALEPQQQQQQQQQQQRKQQQGKEALSKKLLKKAVLASKKIRTLASISDLKQPQVNVTLKPAPRWPVPTVVPVSVAMNRLRAVVCS